MSEQASQRQEPDYFSAEINRLDEFIAKHKQLAKEKLDLEMKSIQISDPTTASEQENFAALAEKYVYEKTASHLADGSYIVADDPVADVPRDILDKFRAMAAKMDVSTSDNSGTSPLPPKLYVIIRGFENTGEGMAEARLHDVFVTKTLLREMNPRQVEAVLGHELAHIEKGDTGFEVGLLSLKDLELKRAIEHRADLVGTGPDGSCDPQSLAEALKVSEDFLKRAFLRAHPDKTEKDFDTILARLEERSDHPPTSERVRYLTDAAGHLPAVCKGLAR